MVNDKQAAARAKECGMTHEQWQAAKSASHSARSRGRVKSRRPVASLWDEVEGQESLFPSLEENVSGGAE